MIHEVTRLQGVREGHPSEVPEGEHETKSVVHNVHGRQDGLLKVERVGDIDRVEEAHHGHRVRHGPVELVLLVRHGQVDYDPPDQPRVQLAELLQVEAAQPRVELPADEEVVDPAPRVATLRT